MADADLALTSFSRDDYAVLRSWFADQAQITQWGGPAVRYPLDDLQLETMLSEPHVRRSWMAQRGDEAIGHAQAMGIDIRTGVARLGRIAIAPSHRGQGLAVPMLRLVLDQLFTMPGIGRVELGVYTWNIGARRTYARLGFVPGQARIASVRIEDEDWDLQEMSLARDAFLGGRGPSQYECSIIELMSTQTRTELVSGSRRPFSLKHPTKPGKVTIAGKPSRDLPPGLQSSILRQAGLRP